jgi:hypothetical protein
MTVAASLCEAQPRDVNRSRAPRRPEVDVYSFE